MNIWAWGISNFKYVLNNANSVNAYLLNISSKETSCCACKCFRCRGIWYSCGSSGWRHSILSGQGSVEFDFAMVFIPIPGLTLSFSDSCPGFDPCLDIILVLEVIYGLVPQFWLIPSSDPCHGFDFGLDLTISKIWLLLQFWLFSLFWFLFQIWSSPSLNPEPNVLSGSDACSC